MLMKAKILGVDTPPGTVTYGVRCTECEKGHEISVPKEEGFPAKLGDTFDKSEILQHPKGKIIWPVRELCRSCFKAKTRWCYDCEKKMEFEKSYPVMIEKELVILCETCKKAREDWKEKGETCHHCKEPLKYMDYWKVVEDITNTGKPFEPYFLCNECRDRQEEEILSKC